MANGILVIDKSAGWTSQDVAAKLRGVFHERRVGHGGTLDPMATGVLPVFIGRATRAAEFLESAEKEYVAGLRLGVVTDTQDTSGTVLETNPVCVTRAQLEAALRQFLGPIEQIPPMYSAIKINGQKLYELARSRAGGRAQAEKHHHPCAGAAGGRGRGLDASACAARRARMCARSATIWAARSAAAAACRRCAGRGRGALRSRRP